MHGADMADALRVLLVHDVLGDLGGAEANVRHAAAGLVARGCAVALLHGKGTGVAEDRCRGLFGATFDWNTGRDAALAAARAWGPQVVYVHKLANLEVLAALVASGLPLVRMVHDHAMYCQREYRYFPWNRQICTRRAGYACALTCGVVRDREGLLPIKLAWPGRKLRELALCRQFRRHIVVTRFMRDELLLHGFDGRRISILPPVPRPARADYTPTYREPLLLFVGQIIRGKGLDVLIGALPRLRTPGWKLLVIGDGGHRATCEREVKRLDLGAQVHFTGWVPQDDLMSHYTTARVGVVPSVWPEPIATIGLEFMQHALPVVAFDVGGMSDWLIDGDNGFLVKAWDLDGLAAAIDRLLGDQALAARMGADGLAKGREQHVYERYLDDLRDLLAREATA
jgi:glycosyltransferase involved in cell wall biosynthesis